MKIQTEKITQKAENEKSIKDNWELSTHSMIYFMAILCFKTKKRKRPEEKNNFLWSFLSNF
ncbi:hypothetical protein [Lactococcus cremoris]|uniref:hypothetical protein n=1 Tax=Lactococcus lactis subsp. cremoris TaxID=1359 RepID=UPI0037BFEF98